MSGLVVSLRPYERVLIGGVVMQNGAKRAQLRVLNDDAGVLRLSDALHPDDVRTPLTRCYYAAQLLVAGGGAAENVATALHSLLADALAGFAGFSFASVVAEAAGAAEQSAWFRVMKLLKPLLPQEAALLTDKRFAVAADRDDPLPTFATVFAEIPREQLTAHKP